MLHTYQLTIVFGGDAAVRIYNSLFLYPYQLLSQGVTIMVLASGTDTFATLLRGIAVVHHHNIV